jgi:hypothetical protein
LRKRRKQDKKDRSKSAAGYARYFFRKSGFAGNGVVQPFHRGVYVKGSD